MESGLNLTGLRYRFLLFPCNFIYKQFSFDLIKRSVQASASILKENSGETEPKSSYESYLSQGLVPKLYRIVYTDDGTINGNYVWGEGIDGPAVIAELTAIPA